MVRWNLVDKIMTVTAINIWIDLEVPPRAAGAAVLGRDLHRPALPAELESLLPSTN